MKRQNWVKLPTDWIRSNGLRQFRWQAGQGSNNAAALMVLPVIAHHADQNDGTASITYDTLCSATDLSRTKVSEGLKVLSKHNIIERYPQRRSFYRLNSFDPKQGWAKIPYRNLYKSDQIDAFSDFYLRRQTELNALKLFFLFIALRDKKTNLTKVSFDKIYKYTGISRNLIKPAQSVLATHGLVYVEQMPSDINEYAVLNAYRIPGIEPYSHRGTRGRAELGA